MPNKIYIIKRFGLVDHYPVYLFVTDGNDIRNGYSWVHGVYECKIYGRVEDAFVALNTVKYNGGTGVEYYVMEIDIAERRVALSTVDVE